ncbi:MAG: hypothetical protein IKY10_03520, partial [Clostridia bacterium]|nr:hypothetical protein [Clostridia bacterium]
SKLSFVELSNKIFDYCIQKQYLFEFPEEKQYFIETDEKFVKFKQEIEQEIVDLTIEEMHAKDYKI